MELSDSIVACASFARSSPPRSSAAFQHPIAEDFAVRDPRCFLAFATGTSWGTFGILIPIVVHAFEGKNETMMIIAISACMAGAVCGDHCSPISDTTIMASAGAQCNHMNHVSTQLPYVMVVAVISCMTYILAGFIQSPVIPLIIGIVLMIGTLIGIKYITSINLKRNVEKRMQ